MVDISTFQEEMTSYEFADDNKYVWYKLDDILRLTELTEKDLQELPEEERNVRELIDGTKVIQEPAAYLLIFFISKSKKVKKMQDWLFNKVLPDIETKGYYIKGV